MTDSGREEVNQLIAELGGKDTGHRMRARAALVEMGSAAVPALLAALDASAQQVRWEAAKALKAIATPAAAKRLVAALADDDTDVRWVVGEALIALGGDAVEPLLTALAKAELPDGAYPGADHVLHDLVKRDDLAAQLKPVFAAFDQPEPVVAVPLAANKALQTE